MAGGRPGGGAEAGVAVETQWLLNNWCGINILTINLALLVGYVYRVVINSARPYHAKSHPFFLPFLSCQHRV